MNDDLVFNKAPQDGVLTFVDFRGDIVKQSDNVITLRSTGAEYKIEDAQLLYFFSRGPSTNSTQTFELTKKEVDSLPGTIEFKINDVVGKPTGLFIDIVRPDRTVTRIVPQGTLQEGSRISITLTESNVDVGKNKAIFLVSGSGGYEIAGFTVRP